MLPKLLWRGGFLLAGLAVFAALVAGLLSLIVSRGPVPVTLLMPFVTSAIDERLGGGRHLDVDRAALVKAEGGTALRLTSVTLRDAGSAVLARLPQVDVILADADEAVSLWRPRRVFVVGASVALTMDERGGLALAAGEGATALALPPAPASPAATSSPLGAMAGLLAWLATLDRQGLDGAQLVEVGLRDSTISIDDRARARTMMFEHINLSVVQPREGGLTVMARSSGQVGPWDATMTLTGPADGRRTIELVANNLAPDMLAIAMQSGAAPAVISTPLSLVARVDLDADHAVTLGQGSLLIGRGQVGDFSRPETLIDIGEGRVDAVWDAGARRLAIPRAGIAGPDGRLMLGGFVERESAEGPWRLVVQGGQLVIGAPGPGRELPLLVDRLSARVTLDPAAQVLRLEQAEVAAGSALASMSGQVDGFATEPRLQFGLAASAMPYSTFRRLWPVPVLPNTRRWVLEHVVSGQVERTDIAIHAPIQALKPDTRPLTDSEIRVDIEATDALIRPVVGLPALQLNKVALRVAGRTFALQSARGAIVTDGGRRIALADAAMTVADLSLKPAPALVRFAIDGPADAVAEVLTSPLLRGTTALPFEPSQVKGNATGTLNIHFPISKTLQRNQVSVSADGDLTQFSIDRAWRGARFDTATLKVKVQPDGATMTGNGRLAGAPVTVEYRKPVKGDTDLRVAGTFDDQARARLGFDEGAALTGPLGVRLAARIAEGQREMRVGVEADFAAARVADLLPGWTKAANRPTRATLTFIERAQGGRIEDLVITGPGVLVRGSADLDANGEFVQADFPQYQFAEADRVSLRVERQADGTARAVMRGDVYDARASLRSGLAPPSTEANRPRKPPMDLDFEARVASVIGFNGEVLRNVEARFARRGGQMRNLAVSARGPRDAAISGALRARPSGQPTIYLESEDAGALFRFADVYSKMLGGKLWVSMDPPTGDNAPQRGVIGVVDFSIRGEGAIADVARQSPRDGGQVQGVEGGTVAFNRMRAEFVRAPGRVTVREGVLLGPAVGATIEGQVDTQRDQMRMTGTFVPAYTLNNLFARIPIIGSILGGGANEGLLGVTYEVTGPVGNPALRISPLSAVAPGFLRRIFDFRNAPVDAPAYADPRQ
jgi:hypothetical protein